MELSKEGTVKESKSINAEEHKFRQKSQKGQSRLIYSQILAVEQNDFVKRMRQTIHRLSQLNWFSHSNEFFIVFISINKQAKYHNQIIIKLMMLKATLRLFTLTAKTCLPLSNVTPLASSLHRPLFTFSQSHKHEKHDKEDHHHEKKHEKEHHEKKHDKEDSHQEKHKHHNPKQAHHQHGPGCKHDHGHHHESHQHSHHQHGPGCNHDHDHHDHHAAHPNVKLSKLSFQELIKLQTQESLKYAHMIYEQELKKLKELQETKEHVQKNIEFYKKLQKEIKEKEHKIEDNIKMYEQELALSTKRAEKQVDQSKSFAVTKIAKELLEVADCIANCKKFAEQSEHKDKYIDLIIQSKEVVRDILKKYEIEQFDPINQEYDPNYQESLLQIPTPPGCKEGHVAIVMRTGYKIKGRLLRSARVGVFN